MDLPIVRLLEPEALGRAYAAHHAHCRSALRQWPKNGRTVTFNLSAYNKMALPSGEGTLADVGDTQRRYPADMWGQWAFFYPSGGGAGLLVMVKDPNGGFCLFSISGTTLSVTTYGDYVATSQVISSGLVTDATLAYKNWAQANAAWWSSSPTVAADYKVMATDSANDTTADTFLSNITGKRAVLMTQWRDKAFDQSYPRFVPASGSVFFGSTKTFTQAIDQYKNNRSADVFCYFNFGIQMAVNSDDSTNADYNAAWNLVDSTGAYVTLFPGLKANYLACPCAAGFSDKLFTQWDSIRHGDGSRMRGVYADVASSNARICWSTSHGHEAGDPYSYVRGLKAIFKRFRDAGARIMAEQAADVYLTSVDLILNAGAVGMGDPIGLAQGYWTQVYSGRAMNCGFQNTVTARRVYQVYNNGSNKCRISVGDHRFTTGDSVTFAGVTKADGTTPYPSLNGAQTVTVIDANTVDVTAVAFVEAAANQSSYATATGPALSDTATLADVTLAESFGKALHGTPPVYYSGSVQSIWSDGSHPNTLARLNT